MGKPHASTETIERLIVGKAVDRLLAVFGSINVERFDDETTLLRDCKSAELILTTVFSGDFWVVLIVNGGGPINEPLAVMLSRGNGCKVLGEWSLDLDDVLSAAKNLAKALEA